MESAPRGPLPGPADSARRRVGGSTRGRNARWGPALTVASPLCRAAAGQGEGAALRGVGETPRNSLVGRRRRPRVAKDRAVKILVPFRHPVVSETAAGTLPAPEPVDRGGTLDRLRQR